MTPEPDDALGSAFLGLDPDLRAIVLTGTGPTFSADADVKDTVGRRSPGL